MIVEGYEDISLSEGVRIQSLLKWRQGGQVELHGLCRLRQRSPLEVFKRPPHLLLQQFDFFLPAVASGI